MAVDRRPQSLTRDFPQAACGPSQHGSWLPQNNQFRRKPGRSYGVFYDLALEVTLYHFLLVTLFNRGGDYKGARVPGSPDHWGPSQRLATTNALYIRICFDVVHTSVSTLLLI